MTKRPNSLRHLDDAIRRVSGGSPQDFIRVRTIMANALVASVLPDGVVKGGSAIKMRYGDEATRFSTDLDTATATDPTLYATLLNDALRTGWEGFTGQVAERTPASPDGVPEEYVMRPYDVRLSYLGKPWCTVPLEVGHNEIGDADTAEWTELTDASALFKELGFPSPGKVPLMPLNYQIAQKLHALSGSKERVRDLIDLQLILNRSHIDLKLVRSTCERLFRYRGSQPWPPMVVKQAAWPELYAEQASGLPVLQSVDDAITWVYDLIDQIRRSN